MDPQESVTIGAVKPAERFEPLTEEVARLRCENAQLKPVNEILKTASVFSRKRSSTANSGHNRLRPRVLTNLRGRADPDRAEPAQCRGCPVKALRRRHRGFGPQTGD
ncbi:hypothetical protein F8O09_08835 [Pseudoclavibacter sp. CFCC 11306]|nr:hypothetical protein F8O09_08835 [Pseudoclavibacter sp. CFCC 11306]